MPAHPFVHLRVHSDYSMSKGASKVKDLVKAAKDHGQPAMALTDDEALYGAMQVTKYAVAEGVQPLIGTKVYLPTGRKGEGKGSILLLAQTDAGYANVCGILNLDLTPNRSRRNVIDKEGILALHAERDDGTLPTDDVICLAGSGADSLLGAVLRENGYGAAVQMATLLGTKLFPGRFYVEICRNGHPSAKEVEVEREILRLAEEMGFPICGTSEVCYAGPDSHDAYSILRAVAEGRKAGLRAGSDGRVVHASPARKHLRSSDEMEDLFLDLPEAYETPALVALRCSATANKRKPILPPYETVGDRSEAEELRIQATDGLRDRLDRVGCNDRAPYEARLAFELGVIESMGFPGYFLIVADFIKYAKSRDIPVGPGRGSGAGSVVAWALTITDLDPLRFGLLFERFLNPERVSMPDFDVDFCEAGRAEVIRYVEEKYTRDRVAGISTFNVIKSKSGLRDVARVLAHAEEGGLSQMEINNIANMVPGAKNGVELKLREVLEQVPEFAERINASPRARVVYDNTLKVEGLFRQTGAHAAGIIIAGDSLTKLVPVGFDPKTGLPVVQLNMKDSEDAGLVKFDFLGLTTLSVIKEALGHVRDIEGVDLDIDAIPFDDKATLDLFAQGRTTGLFQFESDGMKRALKEVKADRIEDLIAVNALFRPGPMEFIPTYAACKNGTKTPKYPEPVDKTKPFLEETFGIMVYQEQVMQVAQASAGYSLGGADLLRRAMGKKIKAEMDAQRSTFVEGCVRTNGLSEKAANALFENIEAFANYGFNKSHAAAYSVVAFQTGYLKAHHRISFFAALLSYETDSERMALIKQDMDQFDIRFLLPDVNRSTGRFRPERKPDGSLGLRFGLNAIKTVSAACVDPMVAEREANGPFASLKDFHARVGRLFNSGQVEKLAEAGAFDALDDNRARAFEILTYLAKNDRRDKTGVDLFGGEGEVTIRQSVLDTSEWADRPDREFASVGFFLTMHPLEVSERRLHGWIKRRKSIVEFMIRDGRTELDKRKLLGMVEAHEIKPGNRRTYVRLKLAERQDTYWINVFTDNPEETNSLLKGAMLQKQPVVVIATFSPGNGGYGDMWVTGNKVQKVDDYVEEHWAEIGARKDGGPDLGAAVEPPPKTWMVVLDPREIDAIRPDTRRIIDDLDARSSAAAKLDWSGDSFLNECSALMEPLVMNVMKNLNTQLGRYALKDDSRTDEIRVTVKVKAGPYSRDYGFGDVIRAPFGSHDIPHLIGHIRGIVSVRLADPVAKVA